MRTRDAIRIVLADDPIEMSTQVSREEDARRAHPYVADLVRILAPHKFGLLRRRVMDEMLRLRGPAELNHPKKFNQAVQSAFQRHSSQSPTFRLTPENDLFHWPKGKGGRNVVWAVHKERASAWLKNRDLTDI
jgi:hypothetical protein